MCVLITFSVIDSENIPDTRHLWRSKMDGDLNISHCLVAIIDCMFGGCDCPLSLMAVMDSTHMTQRTRHGLRR